MIFVLGSFSICVQEGKLDILPDLLHEAFAKQTLVKDSGDDYAYLCATIDFDRAIVKASKNEFLESMFEKIANFLMLAVFNKHQGNIESNFNEHKDILAAVKNKDINLVEKLIKAHYNKPLSKFPTKK